MEKRLPVKARSAVCAAACLFATAAVATPPCDDMAEGSGCIELQGGGSGEFELAAAFDVESQVKSGSLLYVDTAAGFEVNSSTLLDYSYLDPNVRGFIFEASGDGYNEVRVFVADYGETDDQFEIQLLQNGNIVYDQFGYLSAECGGGIVIVSDCGPIISPPPPPPDDQPPHTHPPHPDHPEHPPKPDRPHGNNGVGNGEDPQPPGNPPINDGPGTGPGNPGNRGGAHQ